MDRPFPHPPRGFENFMQHLLESALGRSDLPEEDTPLAKLAREFHANNWAACKNGLLRRTAKIRVWPEPSPAPRVFRFEMDCPYKRKLHSHSPVELMPGPVRGQIVYRGDMFENPGGPTVAVLLDPDQGYFHPNFARQVGILCIGDETILPPGPLPLDILLENHLYPILSYQNRRPSDPADLEAARYFALDARAMEGLEPVEPLY